MTTTTYIPTTKPPQIRGERQFLRAALAMLLPCVSLLVQMLLWRFIHPYVWFLFYPAVFLSSWIGGYRAGVLATALSTVLVLWFFVPPAHSLLKESFLCDALAPKYRVVAAFDGKAGLRKALEIRPQGPHLGRERGRRRLDLSLHHSQRRRAAAQRSPNSGASDVAVAHLKLGCSGRRRVLKV